MESMGRGVLSESDTLLIHVWILTWRSTSYGEKGFQIITERIQSMYPPDLYSDIHGIPYHRFLSYVLVPETTQLLIQQERHVSAAVARKTMEESYMYGDIWFPVDDRDFSDGEDTELAGTGSMSLSTLLNKDPAADPAGNLDMLYRAIWP